VNKGPVRLVTLIRHGQYVPADGGGTLTAVGRRQARAAGKRLAGTEAVDALFCSTLSRARETATLIAERCGAAIRPAERYLCECWPTAVPGYHVSLGRRAEGKRRIAVIAERHLRPSRRDRHEVLVCHGNLIRGVVSHALGARLTSWRKMYIHHGSLTQIAISATGQLALLRYNDTGHLGETLTTMANVDEVAKGKAR
jgi:serine/threonine-protein phosphatase PGAM5